MVFADFPAEIATRVVIVKCPRTSDGDVIWPDGVWADRATQQHPELCGIGVQKVDGAYTFHWTGTVSDDEALFQSVKILKELY